MPGTLYPFETGKPEAMLPCPVRPPIRCTGRGKD
jgi:hypothetical protein